jgi:hypothetical protein
VSVPGTVAEEVDEGSSIPVLYVPRGGTITLVVDLTCDESVVTDLILPGAGARETRCQGGGREDSSVYRYDGLPLIVDAGGRYLLLSPNWDSDGQAIVVPASNDLQLVFTASGATRAATC